MARGTLLVATDIKSRGLREAPTGLDTAPGHVRREQQIWGFEERTVFGDGFLGYDIEGGATNALIFQGVCERGFIYKAASGRIDQNRVGFHFGECHAIHDAS